MAKRRTGRPSAFTREQNRALRELLRVVGAQFPSQGVLGAALGIKQQNASRLLKVRDAGFSYATALAVVRLGGFPGVEAFFSARGVGSEPVVHARAS